MICAQVVKDMAEEMALQELEQLKQENAKLRAENRKLSRQLASLQGIVDRNKVATVAKANLSAIITAERTKLEKYMQMLLENSPDTIMLFDSDGRFAYCTNAFLARANIRSFGLINGRRYQEVLAELVDEDWIAHFESVFNEAMATKETIAFDTTADISKTGNIRNYNIQITPMFNDEGKPDGALALFHDLTEITRAKEQAERANSAKSDFLATVSHEIRTPMNAIIGVSDMMHKTTMSDTQAEYINNIQNSSYVLLNLINDILDFSKIEAGKLDLVNDYFDLRAQLRHLQSMFGLMFDQKHIDFYFEIDADLPRVVYGDEKRLGQILTNILNNALKYTQAGNVMFLGYQDETGALCFDIRDTGIGIREDDIPKLFTAFEQLDKVKNKNVVGTGLGLAITKKLCELMNGTISVQSVYGEGSCFSVRVDLPLGTEENLPEVVTQTFAFVAPKARVLLVDDIEINLIVAASMLESYEIVPVEAVSGLEAVELVRENHFDLVFMDHMMPEMDGVEATKVIRSLGGSNAQVPIVALTANAVSGAMEMFIANGFNGFLSKPIDVEELSACLLKFLPSALIQRVDEEERS